MPVAEFVNRMSANERRRRRQVNCELTTEVLYAIVGNDGIGNEGSWNHLRESALEIQLESFNIEMALEAAEGTLE